MHIGLHARTEHFTSDPLACTQRRRLRISEGANENTRAHPTRTVSGVHIWWAAQIRRNVILGHALRNWKEKVTDRGLRFSNMRDHWLFEETTARWRVGRERLFITSRSLGSFYNPSSLHDTHRCTLYQPPFPLPLLHHSCVIFASSQCQWYVPFLHLRTKKTDRHKRRTTLKGSEK